MSNYDDSEADVDDQSEDGEIKAHPIKSHPHAEVADENASR